MEIHLASMENVNCWAFRKLSRHASDSYTGMLSLTNLVKRNNTWDEVDTYLIEGQRQWIQIATSKEAECAAFIKRLDEEIGKCPEKNNIHGIQLNCSCPSKNLINIGQGPALIKRANKVGTILKELLKQDKYKIGVKFRLGLNALEVAQGKIYKMLEELEKLYLLYPDKFTNVTIHLKHAQQTSSEKYDYFILDSIAAYNLPLVINGGMNNYSDIVKVLSFVSSNNLKNIKGIMLARAALRNPDCFTEITNSFNKTNFSDRSIESIRKEFKENLSKHSPKQIYLQTIKEKSSLLD